MADATVRTDTEQLVRKLLDEGLIEHREGEFDEYYRLVSS